MASKKYLDLEGLTYYDSKLKNYVEEQIGAHTGTTVSIDGSPVAALDFDSDPQTQLNNKLDVDGDGSSVTATFSQASSRTNITSGESLATIFGKTNKYFDDLGSLAFKSKTAAGDYTAGSITSTDVDNTIALKTDIPTVNNGKLTIQQNGTEIGNFSANDGEDKTINIDLSGYQTTITPSTTQSTSTTTVPSDKLLKESSFAKVYRTLADLSSSLTTTSTLADICNAFTLNNSIAILDPLNNSNLAPSNAESTVGLTIITCRTPNSITVEFTANTGERWLCGYHKDSATLYPWKKVDVVDNIAMRGVDSGTNYEGYFRIATAKTSYWHRGAKARIYVQDLDSADWAILDVMPWLSADGDASASRIIVSQGEATGDFRNRFFLVVRQKKKVNASQKVFELWYRQTATYQRITATFMVDISDTRNTNIINKKWEKYNVASSTDQGYVSTGTVDLTNGFVPTASWGTTSFATTDYPDVDIYSENGQTQFVGQYFATKNTTNAYSDTPESASNRAVYFYDKDYTDIAGINAAVGKSWNALNFYLRSKGNVTRNLEFVHYPGTDTWNFDCTTDNSVNLGTTIRRWKNLYLSGSVSDGTNSEDLSDLISDAIDLTGQTIDLNNLNFSVGFPNHRRYVCKTSGGSANITNKPMADYAFVLDVELVRWAGSSDYVTKQTLWSVYNYDVLWIRTCQSGTWGSWFANPYRRMIPICATGGATQAKLVNQPNYTLRNGNMISVYFLAANTAANPTLNINGTGAKDIYVDGVKLTNDSSKPNTLASNLTAGWHTFYYNGTNYYTGTTLPVYNAGSSVYARYTRYISTIVAGGSITAGKIGYAQNDNKYYQIGASASINLLQPLLYIESAMSANGTSTNNYKSRDDVNIASAVVSGTYTQYAPLFLKGVLTGHTFTLASFDWCTTTIPTSEDGFQYLYLGYCLSATNFRLSEEHPIYAYQNGAFTEYRDVFNGIAYTLYDTKVLSQYSTLDYTIDSGLYMLILDSNIRIYEYGNSNNELSYKAITDENGTIQTKELDSSFFALNSQIIELRLNRTGSDSKLGCFINKLNRYNSTYTQLTDYVGNLYMNTGSVGMGLRFENTSALSRTIKIYKLQ